LLLNDSGQSQEDTALSILNRVFGFESFRPLQESIINGLMAGEDEFVARYGPLETILLGDGASVIASVSAAIQVFGCYGLLR